MMFKKDLYEKILKGEKTATRRPIEAKQGVQHYERNKIYGIRCGYTPYSAYIKILNSYRQALGKMTDEDARKEGFENLAEFKVAWAKIYGKWLPKQVVWVYEFTLAAKPDSANRGKFVPLAVLF